MMKYFVYAYNHYYYFLEKILIQNKKNKILTSQKYPLYGSICIMYIVEQRLLIVVMWYIYFMWLSLYIYRGSCLPVRCVDSVDYLGVATCVV